MARAIVEILGDAKDAVRAAAEFGGSLDNLTTKASRVGKDLTTYLTLPILGIGVAAGKASMDFNASMANVATLIPGNTARVRELKEEVQDLAIMAGKATGDVAGGLYEVISAFGDTADTAEILEANVRAAAAGLSSVTEAIKLTSAVTKAYGDTTDEAIEKASDLAFVTVKLGQTTFPELASAIGRVAPLTAQLGMSQEELFAGFATLTGVTGDTAEVSTQLRAILTSMINPTEDMSRVIRALGYESARAMLEERGLAGSIEALTQAAGGSEEVVAKLFGRAEALTAVFALAGPQADTFREKLAALGQAAGATDEAFDEQTKGIGEASHTWASSMVAMSVAAQDLGDALAPIIHDVAEMVSGSSEWFAGLDEGSQRAVVKLGLVAAATGPAIRGVSTLVKWFVALRRAQEGLAAAKGIEALVRLGAGAAGAQATTAGLAGAAKLLGATLGRLAVPLTLVAAGLGAFERGELDAWRAMVPLNEKGLPDLRNGFDLATEAGDRFAEQLGVINIYAGLADEAVREMADSAVRVLENISAHERGFHLTRKLLEEQKGTEAPSWVKEWEADWQTLTEAVSGFNTTVDLGTDLLGDYNATLDETARRAQELAAATAAAQETHLHGTWGALQSAAEQSGENWDFTDHLRSGIEKGMRTGLSYEEAKRLVLQSFGLDASDVPGLAGGGTVYSPGWAWVGEQGPELRYLPRGAQVVPNHEARSLADLGRISVTMYNHIVGARASEAEAIGRGIGRGVTAKLRELGVA